MKSAYNALPLSLYWQKPNQTGQLGTTASTVYVQLLKTSEYRNWLSPNNVPNFNSVTATHNGTLSLGDAILNLSYLLTQ